MPLLPYPRGKIPQCILDRRLGGPRIRLDVVKKRKLSFSCQEPNPNPQILSSSIMITETFFLLCGK
jgi:hypothetical protein